jgi:ATP-dependent Lon protease
MTTTTVDKNTQSSAAWEENELLSENAVIGTPASAPSVVTRFQAGTDQGVSSVNSVADSSLSAPAAFAHSTDQDIEVKCSSLKSDALSSPSLTVSITEYVNRDEFKALQNSIKQQGETIQKLNETIQKQGETIQKQNETIEKQADFMKQLVIAMKDARNQMRETDKYHTMNKEVELKAAEIASPHHEKLVSFFYRLFSNRGLRSLPPLYEDLPPAYE